MIETVKFLVDLSDEKQVRAFDALVNEVEARLKASGFDVFASQPHVIPAGNSLNRHEVWLLTMLVYKARASYGR